MSELDLAGPGLTALAAIAERADCLEGELLAPEPRAACEATVAGWQEETERYGSVRDRALRASRTIATTSDDQPGYLTAAREFCAARAELAAIRPGYRRTCAAAAIATGRLEHDRRERERHRRELADGARARAELGALLGSRLTEALGWEWPLPDWFTSVLGTGPPEDDGSGWRDAAVQLLAYRITYGVRDPDSALGPGPEPSASARRKGWFEDLSRALAGLQVSPTA